MKKILEDLIDNVTRFKPVEFVIIKNDDEGNTIATCIPRTPLMMIKVDMGKLPEFEKPICLGNLGFLKAALSSDQFSEDESKVKFQEGISKDGMDIFTGIEFKSKRMKANYCSIDPKAVKETAQLNNFPPKLPEADNVVKINISENLPMDFRKAFSLQGMLGGTGTSMAKLIVLDDDDLYFSFPQGETSIDILISDNVDLESLPQNLKFDAELLNMAMNNVNKYKNGYFSISSKALDVHYSTGDMEFTIRIPKNTVVKQL